MSAGSSQAQVRLSSSAAYSGVHPIVGVKIKFSSHLASLEFKALTVRKDVHLTKPTLINLKGDPSTLALCQPT